MAEATVSGGVAEMAVEVVAEDDDGTIVSSALQAKFRSASTPNSVL